jgi:hypothetical protein
MELLKRWIKNVRWFMNLEIVIWVREPSKVK